MALGPVVGGTLGTFNIGAAAAAGALLPLSLQLDGLITAGFGPFQAQLAAGLNATLLAQANLALAVSNPLLDIQIALSAIGQLQAALQAALVFPSVQLSITAELSASAALAGTLALQLGSLKLAIKAALAIKAEALQLQAGLAAALTTPGAFAFLLQGDTVGDTASLLQARFATGLDGNISASSSAYGVVLVVTSPSAYLSLQALITVP